MEELTEYIKTISNDDTKRDNQAQVILNWLISTHSKKYSSIKNPLYNMSFITLLLSYLERISYLDKNRVSYDSYCRYATFLQTSYLKENDYNKNMEKDLSLNNKSAFSMKDVIVNITENIEDPMFRVNVILLTICLFKDEGNLTLKQKKFVGNLFTSLQI